MTANMRAPALRWRSSHTHFSLAVLFLVAEFCHGLLPSHCIASRGSTSLLQSLTWPQTCSFHSSSWFQSRESTGAAMSVNALSSLGTQHGTSSGIRGDHTVCHAKKRGGDGHKKPKKAKLDALAAAEEQKNAEPEAARITNKNFGMSMKTQLKLVKAFKKMEEKSTRTVVRTKFRKEKDTVEERNAKKMPETLSNIWSGNTLPPMFLVDGYNVIGHWSKLKKKRDKGNMAGARDTLLQEVSQFAHYRGCQVTVIYDAVGNQFGPAITSAEMEKTGVEVVFVRDESADGYIEARTAELKAMKAAGELDPPEVWICSSDNAIRSISSGHGARTMSSSMFVQEMKRARKEYEGSLLDENHLSRAGGMVEDRIGKEAADALYALMEEMEGRVIRPRPDDAP